MTANSMPTIVELGDVSGGPKIRKDMPSLVIGSRVMLKFRLERKNGPRTEELNVDGEFRVTAVVVDAGALPRQLVTVEAVRVVPVWKSIKNRQPVARNLGPAWNRRTLIR